MPTRLLRTLTCLVTLSSLSLWQVHASPSPLLIAYIHSDNVWVAHADGTAAQQLTFDGTGTRIVHGAQVTYGYLNWSPDGQRLLFARFAMSGAAGALQQGWQLEQWTSDRLSSLQGHISGLDFDPQWSADGRSIAYMAQSRYDQHTTMFHNLVDIVSTSGVVTPLVRFQAHEGCVTTSSDPSELTLWNQIGYGGIRQSFLWSSRNHFLIYSAVCIHTGLTYLDLLTHRSHPVGKWMTEAVLSPDGQQLVGIENHHLVLSRADGTGLRPLLGTNGAELPVWSPSGNSIYYVVRRTESTLRYQDQSGNLFEIEVKRSSIRRFDVRSGRVTALLDAPVHGIGNLSVSPDGRWLYFTRVTNSDALYRHLVGRPHVTNALLQRYGPNTAVVRMPAAGGTVRVVSNESGQVAVSPRVIG